MVDYAMVATAKELMALADAVGAGAKVGKAPETLAFRAVTVRPLR